MIKVQFINHERAGRTVATKFFGGDWLLTKWDELPRNIQWLLAEMSAGEMSGREGEIKVGIIPWLEDWQNGK